MSIKRALDSILEGNLDEMRQNFSSALTTKAVEKLEERKIDIAKNYFGQMQEEVERVDEEKIKMHGIPNKVTPKRGKKLSQKDSDAITITNNLFGRMEALKNGNIQAAGNTKKK
jgi:hypothetical protein